MFGGRLRRERPGRSLEHRHRQEGPEVFVRDAQALGQQPNTLAEVGRIKLVSPPAEELEKGPDGLLRMRNGAPPPVASTDVTLVSGALESSNVNGVEAMVNMISLARQFDISVKIMSTAKEMDEQTTQIVNMS